MCKIVSEISISVVKFESEIGVRFVKLNQKLVSDV